MAKGHALLVGLKSVDPASCNGWDGTGGVYNLYVARNIHDQAESHTE